MTQTTTLSIGGMTCGSCVRHVTSALDGLSGVAHVDVDLLANRATIQHRPDQVDALSLVAAVKDAGYQARVTTEPADAAPRTAAPSCGCG